MTRKYLPVALRTPFPIGIEILNNIMCYILFVPALFWSHITLTLGLLDIAGISVPGPFTLLWGLSFCLYVAQMWFTLSLEKLNQNSILFCLILRKLLTNLLIYCV